jgi:5-histidylcysteine sulfoxide synthase
MRQDFMVTEQLNSIKPPVLGQVSKEGIREYFKNSWEIYEVLFSAISDDSTYYESPDPLRNPLIFYYGHTAAFYINKLKLAGLISEGINDHYEVLFAKGVDPDLPQNLEVIDLWPTVDEVRAYREKVYNVVMNIIESTDVENVLDSSQPLWSLHMGIEHDRIHFETSSVLIRQLPANLVKRPESWEYAPFYGADSNNEWITVSKDTVVLGKQEPSDLYGWDNEYGHKEVEVKAFMAMKNMVTNGEYLRFVEEAYNQQEFWTKEGWEWKERTATKYPKFWVRKGDDFLYRAMFDELDMPLYWPVEVNAHEAWAYCKWMGEEYRLMSEAEFNVASHSQEIPEPLYSEDFNLNMQFGSPTPVGYFSGHSNSQQFNDLFGNVWDWLSNDFYPLEDFKIHPYYEDFSAPYFDDQHSMLLGGAWATTGTGASKYYRLWFRRNFYQHAGFRLAKDC